MKRIRRFVNEAISELKKVSWPTFAQTRTLTVLVFGVSLAVGVYVLLLDTIFKYTIAFLSQSFG